MEHSIFVYKIEGLPTLEDPMDRSIILIGGEWEQQKEETGFLAQTEKLVENGIDIGGNVLIETVKDGKSFYTYAKVVAYESNPEQEKDGYLPFVLKYSTIKKTNSI